jgi:hypothetical protein
LIFQNAKNRSFQQDLFIVKAPVYRTRRQTGVRRDAGDGGPGDTLLTQNLHGGLQ